MPFSSITVNAEDIDWYETCYFKYAITNLSLKGVLAGIGKCKAAQKASELVVGNAHRTWRSILNWTNYYVAVLKLPTSRQGKHQKARSVLCDEDVSAKVRQWLRSTKRTKRTPLQLQKFFNEVIVPSLPDYAGKTVTERTCQNWVNVCGYKFGVFQKGVYVDDYEREVSVSVKRNVIALRIAGIARVNI